MYISRCLKDRSGCYRSPCGAVMTSTINFTCLISSHGGSEVQKLETSVSPSIGPL